MTIRHRLQAFQLKGGYWVLAQLALFLVVGGAPHLWPLLGTYPNAIREPAGIVFMTAGAALFIAGAFHLGSSLTPYPKPHDRSELRRHGVYAWVRHPIYGGIAIFAMGYCLTSTSLLALAIGFLPLVFFAFKARVEEAWLRERYPEYADYSAQTKRFIPFIF